MMQLAPEQSVRLIDSKGCLTVEACCFIDQLTDEQRLVVERHIRSCSVCAQQRALIATTVSRVRRGRPRLVSTLDAQLAGARAIASVAGSVATLQRNSKRHPAERRRGLASRRVRGLLWRSVVASLLTAGVLLLTLAILYAQ